uniref:SH3 domain-containing protein n=2 Tax=Loa loa TaxID=7209 RepID=A0A1I7VGL9_LOALO
MVARSLPECRAHVRKKISTQVRIYGLTAGYLAPRDDDSDGDWVFGHSNGYHVVPTTLFLEVTQPLSSSLSLSPSPSQQLHPRSDLSPHATRSSLNELPLLTRHGGRGYCARADL